MGLASALLHARSHKGKGDQEPPALAVCQPLSIPLPFSVKADPAGLTHALSFVSPPASAVIQELSCSSSQLITSREELGKACWQEGERAGLRESNHRHSDGK